MTAYFLIILSFLKYNDMVIWRECSAVPSILGQGGGQVPPRVTDHTYQWLCYCSLVSQARPTNPSMDCFEYTCPVHYTESNLCCG